MSTRQNKKRKGKVTRERTVTTLTGAETHPSPHTHPSQQHHLQQSSSFLIPTSDDLATTANIMSSPFSVTSSSGGYGGNNVPAPPGFAMPPTDYTPYGYMQPIHPPPNLAHPQQPYYPKSNLPPGLSDLEVLENLKQTIKNNQHEVFRAIPQPEALRSLIKSVMPDPAVSSVPPHPEQISRDTYQPGVYPRADHDVASMQHGSDRLTTAPALSGSGSSGDFSRARKNSLSWDPSSAQNYSRNGAPVSSSNGQVAPSRFDVRNGASGTPGKLRGEYAAAADHKQSVSGSAVSETLHNGGRPSASQPLNVKTEELSSSVRTGAGESGYPPRSSGNGPLGKAESKDDLRSRDAGWSRDGAAQEGRRRSDSDRAPYPPGRHNGDSRAPPSDRLGPSRDQRYPDRDREVARERDRTNSRDWDRDRDRDRDRRWGDWRPREDRRASEYRRPDERHYDARPDRRWEPRPEPAHGDKRPVLPPVDDKSAPPTGSTNRPNEDRTGGVPSRVAPVEHAARPPPVLEERRSAPPPVLEDAAAPPGLSLADVSRPAPSAIPEQRSAPRPAPPLEERISRPPSLQERIGTTAPAAYDTERPPRPAPSLEERLSHTADERPPTTRPIDDRLRPESIPVSTVPAIERDERARQPSGDRFAPPPGERLAPPPPSRAAGYTRAPSVARDDPRAPPRPVSPSLMPSARPPRPPTGLHEPSRERGQEYRPYYRTEFDRPLEEDRRSDGLDIDNPDRYRVPPAPRRYPDEHDRAHVWPPGSPRSDIYAGDAERRRDHRDWYPRSAPWAGESPPPPPPPPPPQQGTYWDTKQPGYYRDYSPPTRYEDRAAWDDRERRYAPYEPRPLSARLTDTYPPPPPEERAPYSRVRARSPSPAPGREDLRPPMKRAREDAYGAPPPAFYEPPPGLGKDVPPASRRATPPPQPGEYPGVPGGRYYEDGDGYREAYGAYGRPVGR